jgi:D-arabinose 1-dehydrogenase-like Zn-dependent alcohol dehydrogenase
VSQDNVDLSNAFPINVQSHYSTFKVCFSAEVAPMKCGGVPVWKPLVKNGAGPGRRVGIVGVSGLGNFGLLWAGAF